MSESGMYDAMIIGAGIVGRLAAIRMCDMGLRCLVVDGEREDRSASRRSAGGIYSQMHPQVASLSPDISGKAEQLAPLLRETMPAWRRLRDRLPDVPLRETGGLVVALEAGEWTDLEQKQKLEQRLGIETQVLDGPQARDISRDLSTAVVGAVFSSLEGHCDPRQLMPILDKELLRLGVCVKREQFIEHLRPTRHGTLVARSRRGCVFEALHCLVATGAYLGTTLNVLGLRRQYPVEALGIQMFQVDDHSLHAPCLTRRIGRKLSVKRIDERHIWIGGGWPTRQPTPDAMEPELSPESQGRNLDEAVNVFPALRQATVTAQWGAYAGWTGDGLPILGRCEDMPQVVIACGGNGFSLAPLYAEVVAGLIEAREPGLDLSAFGVSRFATDSVTAAGDGGREVKSAASLRPD